MKEKDYYDRIILINIHYSKAQGPTYARYLITQLIDDEDFFLQIGQNMQ